MRDEVSHTSDLSRGQIQELKDLRTVVYKKFGRPEDDCYWPEYIKKCLNAEDENKSS